MGKAGAIVEVYQVQAKIWSETKKLEEKTTESSGGGPLACWRLGSQVFQDWLGQVARVPWKGRGREEVRLGCPALHFLRAEGVTTAGGFGPTPGLLLALSTSRLSLLSLKASIMCCLARTPGSGAIWLSHKAFLEKP